MPIGIAAFVLASRLLAREDGLGLRAGADVPGAVLVTGALMLGVYTIVDAESWALGARRRRRCSPRSWCARRRPSGRCCGSAS